MKKICVMGAGSWGTAVAVSLVENGCDVTLYCRSAKQEMELKETSINKKYLPDFKLPGELKYTSDIIEATKEKDIIVLAVTSQGNEPTLHTISNYVSKDTIIVNISKGFDRNTSMLCSEIIKDIMPENPYAVLSGPSHAEEVIIKMPTALVCASENIEVAKIIQKTVSNEYLRVYTSLDVKGVELGGALKNIIALGIGIVHGLGYGDNTKAAIMTRGITEITRFGVGLGATPETFSGLAGIGDLIVTCTSNHSRNRRAGILIGQGKKLQEVQQEINMVVEGIIATSVVTKMAKKMGTEMPITQEIYSVLFEDSDIKDSVKKLMGRDHKDELEEF